MSSRASRVSKKLLSWSNIVFFILCCIVMYVLVRNIAEIKTIKSLFRQVDPWWMTAALVAQALTYVATAALYHVLLDKVKDKTTISMWHMFKMSIVIVFINQVVPSGGLGGNGFLFNELSKNDVPSKKAFFAIIMECLCLYVAMTVLLIVVPAWYLIHFHTLPHLFFIAIIYGFAFYAVLAVVMTIVSRKETAEYLIKKLSRFRFIRHYLDEVTFSPQGTFTEYGAKGPWGIFKKYPKEIIGVVAGHLTVFLADAFTIFALSKGLELHLSVIVILLGLLLSNIIAALPISPGALLLFEGAMTFFYTAMGVPFQAALVITLLYRVLSFWLPVIIGLLLYKQVQTKKN